MMKAPVLVVLLLGMVWLRGLAPAGEGVASGYTGALVASDTRPLRNVEADSTAPAYTPTPQPGLSLVLAPGETVRVPHVEVWRASLVIADERRYELLRACYCESGFDTTAVGAAGEQGSCQVMARFHGPVPADLAGQFAQADRIAGAQGMTPWTTRDGCGEWSK